MSEFVPHRLQEQHEHRDALDDIALQIGHLTVRRSEHKQAIMNIISEYYENARYDGTTPIE